MFALSREFEYEQNRLDAVMAIIEREMDRLGDDTNRRKSEVISIRKHFWDEVKVNTDSFDDYLETIIGLRQEAQLLAVNESEHRHSRKQLKTLQRMKDIPYFGRIDFHEDGESNTEQIYIGISSLQDENGMDFLIYDWRAPVSSMYYDQELGRATYDTPGGQISGEIKKKMQYIIRDGKIESMFDTSMTIGDEILQEVLGKNSNKTMKNIVATIQQDQNKIIRHDKKRLLIVHGAAGSGKTSAALQRIAYLLYKYRDSINSDQIILFSPNTMFSQYVSNVLPELGEENMQQVTFQDYLDHRLNKEFTIETPYDQLEYILTKQAHPDYDARLENARFKASTAFVDMIQTYRTLLETEGMMFKDIIFRGKTVISKREIKERFYTYDTDNKFFNRLELLKDWILVKLKEILRKEKVRSWVEAEIELFSDEQYYKAQTFLAKKKGYKPEDYHEYELTTQDLATLVVGQKLRPLRKKVRQFEFIDLKAIYAQLFTTKLTDVVVPKNWPTIIQLTKKMLADDILFYEDTTPFLFLKELILGFQFNSAIKQVVIDEAQDYSPFQFEFLKRLFPMAKMTVLGDFNQAIFSHADDEISFQSLHGLYGQDQTEVINLYRSYRSTKPIIDCTKTITKNGEKIVAFERMGEAPTLKQVDDTDELHAAITNKVKDLQAEGHKTIAIICKSQEEATDAYESLKHIEGLKRLQADSPEYERGIVVIPAYLAKGIEFDAVIVYNASKSVYGEESLRRLFYTVCTRAMHRLDLYSIGKRTLFLEEALENNLLKG